MKRFVKIIHQLGVKKRKRKSRIAATRKIIEMQTGRFIQADTVKRDFCRMPELKIGYVSFWTQTDRIQKAVRNQRLLVDRSRTVFDLP